jgi:hypothetical protein
MARLKFRTDGTTVLIPFRLKRCRNCHRHCSRRPQNRRNLSCRQRYRQLKRSRTFQPSKARLRLTHRHLHCN